VALPPPSLCTDREGATAGGWARGALATAGWTLDVDMARRGEPEKNLKKVFSALFYFFFSCQGKTTRTEGCRCTNAIYAGQAGFKWNVRADDISLLLPSDVVLSNVRSCRRNGMPCAVKRRISRRTGRVGGCALSGSEPLLCQPMHDTVLPVAGDDSCLDAASGEVLVEQRFRAVLSKRLLIGGLAESRQRKPALASPCTSRTHTAQ
jgi:hypothetical protein